MAERDRWLEQRRTEYLYLQRFRDTLISELKTGLIRYDLDEIEVEDEFELEFDFQNEMKVVLVETEYHFGTIEVVPSAFRFAPTSSHHQELKPIEAITEKEFVEELRATLVEYLAAVVAEDDE